MNNSITERIKERGYWRVGFCPLTFERERIHPLPKCNEVVEKAVVRLRGWDYPHLPKEGAVAGANYVEGVVDWEMHKEMWRMYQSGQFVHYKVLQEDWTAESDLWRERKIKPGTILSVIAAVYVVTEAFEFVRRVVKQGYYEEGVEVTVGLHNTQNRELRILDPMRGPLFGVYRSAIPDIERTKTFTKQEITEGSREVALDTIVDIFYRFNWTKPPIEVLRNDQQKLLERRL